MNVEAAIKTVILPGSEGSFAYVEVGILDWDVGTRVPTTTEAPTHKEC